MLRRALFSTILAFGVLAFLAAPAQACSVTATCASSCTLNLTCPNGCPIYCENNPVPASLSCTGSSTCNAVDGSYVECDGNHTYCAPFMCTQGTTWIQCNNNQVVSCPDPCD